MHRFRLSTGIALSVLFPVIALADAPGSMCVQGFLETNPQMGDPAPVTAMVTFRVCLYDAETGGNEIRCLDLPSVSVDSGLFSLILDGQLGPEDFRDPAGGEIQPRWLEISTLDPQSRQHDVMTPRVALRTTPYAFRTAFVGNTELTDQLVLGDVGSAGSLLVRSATLATTHVAVTEPAPEFFVTNGHLPASATVVLSGNDGRDGGGRVGIANGVEGQNVETITLDALGSFGAGFVGLRGADGSERVQLWAGEGPFIPYSALRLFNSTDQLRVNIEGGHPASQGGSGEFNGEGTVSSCSLAASASGRGSSCKTPVRLAIQETSNWKRWPAVTAESFAKRM